MGCNPVTNHLAHPVADLVGVLDIVHVFEQDLSQTCFGFWCPGEEYVNYVGGKIERKRTRGTILTIVSATICQLEPP